MVLGPSSMPGDPFGVSVPGPNVPAPPLTKSGHRRVVSGHLGIDPQDLPANDSESDAQVRFFTGDQARVEAADGPDRLDPHQGITAAIGSFTDGRVPLQVGQTVVKGTLGEQLPATATDDGPVGAFLQRLSGLDQPVVDHLAIAVDELDVLEVRLKLQESVEPGVPGPGRRERDRQIKLDDLNASGLGCFDAAVGRTGVDVDNPIGPTDHGVQTSDQPFAFITTDGYDPDISEGRGSSSSRRLGNCGNGVGTHGTDRKSGEIEKNSGEETEQLPRAGEWRSNGGF